MKNNLLLAVVAVFSVFIFSCTGAGGNGPENVAQDFLDAIDARDFEKAKTLSTEESQKMIDLIAGFAEMAPDTAKVEPKKVSKCEIEGDMATCTYCCDSEGAETTLSMKKVGDAWKADMSKETLFGDENPMEDINLDEMMEDTTGEEILFEEDTTAETTEETPAP